MERMTQEYKIWDAIHNPLIKIVHSSAIFISVADHGKDDHGKEMIAFDEVQEGFMRHIINIPFSNRYLALKWAEYVIASTDSILVTSICMNLRSSNHTVDSSYTVNDLLFFIKAFSVMPFLESLFLEGWDDVCERENSFPIIESALYDFLKTKEKFFIRFYTNYNNNNNNKNHFRLLSTLKNVQLSFCDEDWD
jgi:hypothetical protein